VHAHSDFGDSGCALGQGLDEHIVHTFGPDRLRGLAIRGRGQPHATRLALASGGRIDYERIQPLDGPSLDAEHLERCGEGLHHLGSSVDDLEAAIAAMAGRGYAVLQAGARVGDSGDGADAYFDTARRRRHPRGDRQTEPDVGTRAWFWARKGFETGSTNHFPRFSA
jgi:hypothetical protein